MLMTKEGEQPKGNMADVQETTSEIPFQKRAILGAAKMGRVESSVFVFLFFRLFVILTIQFDQFLVSCIILKGMAIGQQADIFMHSNTMLYITIAAALFILAAIFACVVRTPISTQ